MTLTSAECRRFEEQGIVFPLRVLSATEADRYRRECDALEASLGGRPRTIEVRQMHLHLRWAHALATLPSVLDAVEDLLGPNLLVTATELFAKHPQESAVSIGWHRDGPYMGLDPDRTVTAWIALTDCSAENGCMRYVREADRRAAQSWNTSRGQASGQSENRLPVVAAEQMSEVVLRAGEMSLHDVFVLHGSGPNCGSTKRVGFAIRYTTPESRPAHGRPPAVLARGEDRCGHFELRTAPQGDDDKSALDELRQSARAHLETTLQNLKQPARR